MKGDTKNSAILTPPPRFISCITISTCPLKGFWAATLPKPNHVCIAPVLMPSAHAHANQGGCHYCSFSPPMVHRRCWTGACLGSLMSRPEQRWQPPWLASARAQCRRTRVWVARRTCCRGKIRNPTVVDGFIEPNKTVK